MADFKYILFTHLPKPFLERALKALENVADRLGACLNEPDAHGILVLFVDPGWLSLLNTIGTDFNPVKMAEEFGEIEKIKKRVNTLLKDTPTLCDRLRLVTAETLYPILNNLRGGKPGLEATRLKKFLAGTEPGVRYDTTKVVEALVRVRHLGSGIPVLRVDWDALLNDETVSRLLSTLARSIPNFCSELAANHRVHSYVVSGLYDRPLKKPEGWNISDFNKAFATRIFPALVPTAAAILKLDEAAVIEDGVEQDCKLNSESEFTRIVEPLFDRNVMIKYYGLEKSDEGLPGLGSDPVKSVVSGAGMVISEGAILDLPPFSNFRQNVMWIDDYLKYELHRALGHFAQVSTTISVSDSLEAPCRHPSAKVYKDRILAGQGNLRIYTLGGYIPTLFWGILLDGWIRSEGNPEERTPFVVALEDALKRGIFEDSERNRLRSALRELAITRINKVIRLWSALKSADDVPSFAALWVGGKDQSIRVVLGCLSEPKDKDQWLGWGLLKKQTPNIKDLSELRESVRRIVEELIEDMCTYIDWTLEWPKFIQSVRAVRRTGSLKLELDVSYESPASR